MRSGRVEISPAFVVVERLLNQGEPPLVILSMMVRHVRLLWSVKQLGQQRHDASHMAKALGLPLAVCRQLVTQSRAVFAGASAPALRGCPRGGFNFQDQQQTAPGDLRGVDPARLWAGD